MADGFMVHFYRSLHMFVHKETTGQEADKIEATEEEAKKMTVAGVDALKMLSKTTEAAEAPMPTETREGALKIAAEAHKMLEMVSEELKLMDFESNFTNRIIQGFAEMVAATT